MNHINKYLYYDILNSIPISCVDICIVYEGHILLIKRNDPPAKDQWWIPGGRVFKGEMLKETAKRKAIEETGLDCYIGPIIHTDETIFPDGPNDIPIHSINVCFLLYPKCIKRLEVQLDEHSSYYKWVDKIDNDLHPYVKKCLEKAGL